MRKMPLRTTALRLSPRAGRGRIALAIRVRGSLRECSRDYFRFRGSSAQASGALGFDLIGSSHMETPPHPDCFAIRPLPARGERLSPRAIS